ncbi:MAG: DUF368 domain-containing protein [Spirochaetes bacterium]|nr:DUF368 domain-containing protein [Spirochaetota bacterium]
MGSNFTAFLKNSLPRVKLSVMEILKLLSIGLVLGIVVVVPGVSTGTLAVAFNIYERIIAVLTPNVKKILAAKAFWLPLAAGALAGIFLFSRIITALFATHPVPVHWFFIGIIAGSLPLIYRKAREPGKKLPAPSAILCALAALALMIAIAFANPADDAPVRTELTAALAAALAAGGALAAAALIIPGLSGAFALLIVGLYRTVIQAVSDFNIPLIIPVAIGAVIGLFAGAALVRLLLEKAPRKTYGVVLGLLAGTAVVMYPAGLPQSAPLAVSVASLLAGGAVSFFFSRETKAGR